MEILNNFITITKEVFVKGVFNLSLFEIGCIFFLTLVAITLRGVFVKLILKKIVGSNKAGFTFSSSSIYLEKNDLVDYLSKNLNEKI